MILGPSRIQTYLMCPAKYKYQYVERLKKSYEAQKRPQVVISIRDALEAFFSYSNDRSLEMLHQRLRDNWIRDGFFSRQEERKYGLDAQEMLTWFFYSADTRAKPFLVKRPFQTNLGGYTFRGIIPRVDCRDNSSGVLVDYSLRRAQPDLDKSKYDFRYLIYQWACEKIWKLKISSLKVFMLRQKTSYRIKWSENDISDGRIRLLDTAHSIENEYDFLPKANPYCIYCSYRLICPEHSKKNEINSIYFLLRSLEELSAQKMHLSAILKSAGEIIKSLDFISVSKIIIKNLKGDGFISFNRGEWQPEDISSDIFEPIKRNTEENYYKNVLSEEKNDKYSDYKYFMPLGQIWNPSGLILFSVKESPDDPALRTFSTHLSLILENAILYYRAITDPLTKIYNRSYFIEKLIKEIELSVRYKRHLSVVMIDLDHFKKINDTYGHSAGDSVLKHTTGFLQGHLNEMDILSRWGGEEFIIMKPDSSLEESKIWAEKVMNEFSSAPCYTAEGYTIKISMSMGISCAPPLPLRQNILIENADHALYDAKEAGRNCVKIFS